MAQGTSTSRGAYSRKYQQAERDRWAQWRVTPSSKVSRDREHTLSRQTAQRQRALELKKQAMAREEEERRKRALEERRQSQREATERCRMAMNRMKGTSRTGSGSNNYRDIPIEYLRSSQRPPHTPPPGSAGHRNRVALGREVEVGRRDREDDFAPSLDDVLKAIRGQRSYTPSPSPHMTLRYETQLSSDNTPPHTPTNTPHSFTYTNTPHTHTSTPHTHTSTPHTNTSTPHTHTSTPHTLTSTPHTAQNVASTTVTESATREEKNRDNNGRGDTSKGENFEDSIERERGVGGEEGREAKGEGQAKGGNAGGGGGGLVSKEMVFHPVVRKPMQTRFDVTWEQTDMKIVSPDRASSASSPVDSLSGADSPDSLTQSIQGASGGDRSDGSKTDRLDTTRGNTPDITRDKAQHSQGKKREERKGEKAHGTEEGRRGKDGVSSNTTKTLTSQPDLHVSKLPTNVPRAKEMSPDEYSTSPPHSSHNPPHPSHNHPHSSHNKHKQPQKSSPNNPSPSNRSPSNQSPSNHPSKLSLGGYYHQMRGQNHETDLRGPKIVGILKKPHKGRNENGDRGKERGREQSYSTPLSSCATSVVPSRTGSTIYCPPTPQEDGVSLASSNDVPLSASSKRVRFSDQIHNSRSPPTTHRCPTPSLGAAGTTSEDTWSQMSTRGAMVAPILPPGAFCPRMRVSLSQHRQPISQYTQPVSQHRQPISQYRQPISQHRQPVSHSGLPAFRSGGQSKHIAVQAYRAAESMLQQRMVQTEKGRGGRAGGERGGERAGKGGEERDEIKGEQRGREEHGWEEGEDQGGGRIEPRGRQEGGREHANNSNNRNRIQDTVGRENSSSSSMKTYPTQSDENRQSLLSEHLEHTPTDEEIEGVWNQIQSHMTERGRLSVAPHLYKLTSESRRTNSMREGERGTCEYSTGSSGGGGDGGGGQKMRHLPQRAEQRSRRRLPQSAGGGGGEGGGGGRVSPPALIWSNNHQLAPHSTHHPHPSHPPASHHHPSHTHELRITPAVTPGVTGLSMDEQKLMRSIEKINRRLKNHVNSTRVPSHPSQHHPSHPHPHHSQI